MRNSNVNYFDYFPVSCDGVGSVSMHQLNYNNLQYDLLEIFVSISPLPPAFFSSSFYSSFSFSWEKNIIFLHCSKIETDLKKQMTSIGWESIVGFHMTSLKFKLQKLSILLGSYFHDVLEQLKTNFHTTFRFGTKTRSLYIYLVSFPRFRTSTIERFWFLFWYVLNGVTLKTSNRVVIGCFSLLPC